MLNKTLLSLFPAVLLSVGCSTSSPTQSGVAGVATSVEHAASSGLVHSIMPGRDELLKRALERNSQIKGLRKVAEKADKLYRARNGGRSPEIRWAYSEEASGDNQEDLQLGLRVFPEEPWAWLSDREAGKAMAELARLDAKIAEQELLYKVSSLYIKAQWLKAQITYAEMGVENAATGIALNQALVDAGQSTLGDSLKVKLQELKAGQNVSSLQAEYDGLLSLLGAEVGLAPQALHPLIGEQDGRYRKDLPLSATAEGLINHAQMNSLPLQSLAHQHTLMGLELKDDLSPVIPWLRHLQASWNENLEGGDDSWRLSGAITLPVFAMFSGRGSLIEALDGQLETEKENAKNILSSEIQEQYGKWVAADKQSRDFAQHSEPMLLALLEEVERMSGEQGVTPGFLVDQQEVLLNAFKARANILFARDEARLELRRLTGQLER